ncbi:unnamed protein product [Thelazia callipaeda]|uniref:Box C/D snoRNA protein 1 n=1 Tax=Thelazia callipaeda TaxID=103827 RepID=A0A0N5CMM3_THECL|nr:unnamed protein product [Thelazia callipaeda]
MVEKGSMLEETSSNSTTSPRLRICDMCQKNVWKYRCPRCSFRTCSLLCSKEHKQKFDCSGEREKSFDVLKRLDDYSPVVAIDDEKFLNKITSSLKNNPENSVEKPEPDILLSIPQSRESRSIQEITTNTKDDEKLGNDGNVTVPVKNSECTMKEINDEKELTSKEQNAVKELNLNQLEWKAVAAKRYLVNNAHRRRIWLTLTPEKEHNSSRHEQYSDTIFWTIKIVFRREEDLESGKRIINDEYMVNNIPETITTATLLRQFIKPKQVGPVISKSDLNAEKMAPFWEAGMDKLILYMPVPIEDKQRFYVIDQTKTILDNMRNRFILEHPTFVITLDNQFNDYVMLSEQEAQELRELQRQKNRAENQSRRHNNYHGRGRSDHAWFMNRRQNNGRGFKRPHCQSHDRGNQGPGRCWKFGRPSRAGYFQDRFCSRVRNMSEMSLSGFETENCNERSSSSLEKVSQNADVQSKSVEVKPKILDNSAHDLIAQL